jgi:hypothetical protein
MKKKGSTMKDLVEELKGDKSILRVAELADITVSTFYTQLKNDIDIKIGGVPLNNLAKGLSMDPIDLIHHVTGHKGSLGNDFVFQNQLVRENKGLRDELTKSYQEIDAMKQRIERDHIKLEEKEREKSEFMIKYITLLEEIAKGKR